MYEVMSLSFLFRIDYSQELHHTMSPASGMKLPLKQWLSNESVRYPTNYLKVSMQWSKKFYANIPNPF